MWRSHANENSSLMDKLPAELLHIIFQQLNTTAILNVLCVNYEFYLFSLAYLFRHVSFFANPYTAEMDMQSVRLLYQLYNQKDIKGATLQRMSLVRSIRLLPSTRPCFRVTPHAFYTLSTIFFQLL